MANVAGDTDAGHDALLRHRYLVRFEEDTLRQRPLWIRLIIELIGTFILATVAAGSGVINHYVGGGPISRTAAVIAPGAVVMAMIYAWGPLSGVHINPAVTFGFTARGVFPPKWVLPYWVVQFAGAIGAALFLQWMFGDVSAGGNYPITTPGGEWKSLVMETALTAILVSIILNTATGHRSIGHNAAIAVGSTVALLGLFASPISGASMNPARSLGPDIVSADYTGWWIYLAGPVIGAAIAVIIIGLVRGLPDRSERVAAEGGALPMLGADGRRPSPEAKDPTGGVARCPGSFLPESRRPELMMAVGELPENPEAAGDGSFRDGWPRPFPLIGRRSLAWAWMSIEAWHLCRWALSPARRRGEQRQHVAYGHRRDVMTSHLNSGPGGIGGGDGCCTSAW